MPRFTNPPPREPGLPAGVYCGKITRALEQTSAAGNSMISMVFTTSEGRRIQSIVTFVAAAGPVIAALCDSCGLIRPTESGVQVELTAESLRGRHVYFIVEEDIDSNGETSSRVSWFLTREKALRLNPKLAECALPPQEPLRLEPLNDPKEAL
jgi:hypothetical protein